MDEPSGRVLDLLTTIEEDNPFDGLALRFLVFSCCRCVVTECPRFPMFVKLGDGRASSALRESSERYRVLVEPR